MYQQKIIHRDWAFLSNSIGKDIKTLTNEEEGRKKSLVGSTATNQSLQTNKKSEVVVVFERGS